MLIRRRRRQGAANSGSPVWRAASLRTLVRHHPPEYKNTKDLR